MGAPSRNCTPCQWNNTRAIATWVVPKKYDGLGLFLCEGCKQGYNLVHTVVLVEAFWERWSASRSLELLGLPR